MSTTDFPILILGAGFSGIGMGIRLKQAGIDSFTILERAGDIGGTWRDNHYPGAACDVHSHLYSYGFEQNPEWSRAYGEQPEIQAYIRDLGERHDIYRHVRFNTEVAGARFDEDKGIWTVDTDGGERLQARVLISAVGALADPSYPDIPGLDSFQGKLMHTSRWDSDVDLSGKRVGVIGTGASAIQIVPAIAPEVGQLKVFQRTPPWVVPKFDRAMSEWEKLAFRHIPGALALRRTALYWMYEFIYGPMIISASPWLKRLGAALGRYHIEKAIDDPELRDKLTPDYEFGCKRVLISNDYYPALARDNVELVDGGVARLTANGAVDADGNEHELDVVVSATGFDVPTAGAPVPLQGREGRDLGECWSDGAEAYKGVTVSGFPNLFFLLGPNTGPGHTSVLAYTETQIDYTVQAIRMLIERDLKYVDVKQSVQDRFNRDLHARMDNTIWLLGGCNSWYLAPSGKNTTLYPDFNFKYQLSMRRFDPRDYELVPKDRGPRRQAA